MGPSWACKRGEAVAVWLQSGFMAPHQCTCSAASIQVPAGDKWRPQTRLFLEGLRNRLFEQSCRESGEKLQHLGPVRVELLPRQVQSTQKKTYFQNPREKALERTLQVRTLGNRDHSFHTFCLWSLGVVPRLHITGSWKMRGLTDGVFYTSASWLRREKVEKGAGGQVEESRLLCLF